MSKIIPSVFFNMRTFLLFLVFNILISVGSFAEEQKELNIEFNRLYPMIYQENGIYTGFDIELIDLVCKDIGYSYKLKEVDRSEKFNDLLNKNTDLVIGGISITKEREELYDFSLPYMEADIIIASRLVEQNNLISILINNKSILYSILFVMGVIVFCSHLIWLSEKTGNSEHPDSEGHIDEKYFPGIFEAMWMSWITITTIGYGDYVARQWLGKLCTFILTVVGLAAAANFVAAATQFDISNNITTEITDITKISTLKIGVIKNTTSDILCTSKNYNVIYCNNQDELLDKLINKDIDIIMYDSTSIKHMVKNNSDKINYIDIPLQKQFYGIALDSNNIELKEKINLSILELQENGILEVLYKKYF